MGATALMTVVAGPLAPRGEIKEGAANTKDTVEKYQLDGLRMIRNAGDYAKRLLQVAPDADAYLVLGAAN
jgi:hypothetical protein